MKTMPPPLTTSFGQEYCDKKRLPAISEEELRDMEIDWM